MARAPTPPPVAATPDALVVEATRCFAAGRLDEAAALCRRALAAAPDHPAAGRQLGLILVLGGDFAAARAQLEPLAARYRDDADFRLALAEAVWGAQDAATALDHFAAACTLAPDRPRLGLRHGQALLAAGDTAAAHRVLTDAAARLPGSALALTQLGLAEAAVGATERALACFAAALALDDHDPDPAFQLGQALRGAGRLDDAIAAFRTAVARDPASALLRAALGDALHARGARDAALAELREAVRLAPDWPLAWMVLGRTVQRLGRTAEALTYYRTARGLDHGMPELDAIIGNALLETGAETEAQAHFADSMAPARWNWPAAPPVSTRPRVGVLLAPGANNTPTGFILDPAAHDLEIVFMLDGYDYPYPRIAQSYDVLFNAIGDPDRAVAALDRACAFVDQVGLPVVNPPALIRDTGRDRMAARLALIAGCTMPETRRGAAADWRADALAHELGLPLLARPLGSHGGTDLEKLDTIDALAARLAGMGDRELYVTPFHDFRSPDGHYRKYRFIIVAGEILPYHLAIGDGWLVHYFRTNMPDAPALLAEEAHFLDDYPTAIGATAAAALAEIARRVPLDFFGVDCALDAGGRLLVFECNAAMLVHDADPSPIFDYKRAPIRRIRAAVSRLLARQAAP